MPSLKKLPFEIQLLILRYCLKATAPLLNFDTLEEYKSVRDNNKPLGHDSIFLPILQSCRLYHHEGTKILWEQNTHLLYGEKVRLMLHSRLSKTLNSRRHFGTYSEEHLSSPCFAI